MDPRPLWDHQREAIKAAEVIPDLGLFFEQGTGKTRTMIEILRRRYAKAGRVMRTLIVAPPIVLYNWKSEFKMYSKVNPNDIVILTKSGARRKKDFIKAVGEDLSHNKIIITNYEAMQMNDLYALILQWGVEVLVCDESQRVKNHESIRARKLQVIGDGTQFNYILTGTPILNTPADIFMQYRILDRGTIFGKNFYAFRGKYFEDANARRKGTQGYFPKWECRPNAYADLQSAMFTKGMRVLKADCLDLPPLVRQVVHVELSPEQLRMYKEMHTDYITFVNSKREDNPAVVAQLAVTKMMRLQQIVSGFVKDENGAIHRLECPRLTALKDLLDDLAPHHKIIVWAVFHENYRQIAEVCADLGLKYTELHGEISAQQKRDNAALFREDPYCRVMIANQAAGGVGVNLVEASYSIYYSKGYKLEDDLQSEARNHRGGSEIHEKVTRIDLVARGTSDELVNDALANKQNISEQILNWRDGLCQFD